MGPICLGIGWRGRKAQREVKFLHSLSPHCESILIYITLIICFHPSSLNDLFLCGYPVLCSNLTLFYAFIRRPAINKDMNDCISQYLPYFCMFLIFTLIFTRISFFLIKFGILLFWQFKMYFTTRKCSCRETSSWKTK